MADFVNPDDVPGLREVVQLYARRPSRRLRPLVMRCQDNNHTVAQVFAVPRVGPVLVALTENSVGTAHCQPVRVNTEAAADPPVYRYLDRAHSIAIVLNRPSNRISDIVKAQCRCKTVWLAAPEVREWLAAGLHVVRVPVSHIVRLADRPMR